MSTDPRTEASDDRAAVERWLDREHHRFPSHPLVAPIARLLSSYDAALSRAEELEREVLRLRAIINEDGLHDPELAAFARQGKAVGAIEASTSGPREFQPLTKKATPDEG